VRAALTRAGSTSPPEWARRSHPPAAEPRSADATLSQILLARTRVRMREFELEQATATPLETQRGATSSRDSGTPVTFVEEQQGATQLDYDSDGEFDPQVLITPPEDGLDEWDNLMMPVPKDMRGVLERGALVRPPPTTHTDPAVQYGLAM
jgi:hypothetical protein